MEDRFGSISLVLQPDVRIPCDFEELYGFLKACEFLGVQPEDAVHVGDDRRNDIWGARDARCDAWLWGSDVKSFKER
ncbi:hypothetical protein OROGR_008744 [Orobanche gracilis]